MGDWQICCPKVYTEVTEDECKEKLGKPGIVSLYYNPASLACPVFDCLDNVLYDNSTGSVRRYMRYTNTTG